MAKKAQKDTTPTAAPVAQKSTHVGFVLDRSSSMYSCVNETISGFNEQVDAITASGNQGGETDVTLYTFNGEVREVYVAQPISRVQKLTKETYVPQGSTAYYDAMGRAITTLESKATGSADEAFLVVGITDGEENSSKEWTASALKAKIDALTATGKWTFVYVGAGMNLAESAVAGGMSAGNVATYSPTSKGTKAAFSSLADNSRGYFSMRSAGLTSTESFYGSDGISNLEDTQHTVLVGVDTAAVGNDYSAPITVLKSRSVPVPPPTPKPRSDYD